MASSVVLKKSLVHTLNFLQQWFDDIRSTHFKLFHIYHYSVSIFFWCLIDDTWRTDYSHIRHLVNFVKLPNLCY